MTRTDTVVRPRASDEAAAPLVSVRVLPQGDGRVFTGEAEGSATHGRGAVFAVARTVAEALEARGLVEIQP